MMSIPASRKLLHIAWCEVFGVTTALSSDPQRAIESGRDLRLDPMRCYANWRGMAHAEAMREDGSS